MSRFGSIGKQYFDDAGDPLISGKLYFYESGTSTPKDTFADINEEVLNTNPVILTAAGRQPDVFFTGSAKVILTKSDGTQIEARDPIGSGIGSAEFVDWDAESKFPAQTILTGPDGLYYRTINALGQGFSPPNDLYFEHIEFNYYYNPNRTYGIGAVVYTDDGARFVSRIAGNQNNTPSTSAVEWKPDQVTGITKVSRTSNVILVAANTNDLIEADGTYTQTFDPSVDLGADWFCYYRNSGSGAVTLDPFGSETINGLASLVVTTGQAVMLQCDGAGFTSILLEAPAIIAASNGIIIANPAGGAIALANAYYALVVDAAYVLPDITGTLNFGLMSLENSPAVPSSIETFDGWAIATTGLAANTTATIAPLSTATAHGTWGSGIVATPPLLDTMTASGVPTLRGTAELTPGLVVLIYTVSTTGIFVVALDTDTNTFGAPVSLGTWSNGDPVGIFADSSSTFLAYFASTTAGTFTGASVTGTAITLGTPVTALSGIGAPPVQLASGSYFYAASANQGFGLTQTGAAVSIGSSTALGGMAGDHRAVAIDGTKALITAVENGGSVPLKAIVVTLSGTAVTAGSLVTSGENINSSGGLDLLQEYASGGPFLVCCQDQAVSTSMNFFGITISGTVPTIGTALTRTFTQTTDTEAVTFQYQNAFLDDHQDVYAFDATNMLVGIGTEPFALSISGTTLSEGTGLTGIGATKIVTDAATGNTFYMVGSSAFDEVTVLTGSITSVVRVAASPQNIASATLTDEAVNYSGVWYAWALNFSGAPLRMITPTKWLWLDGSTFVLHGEIT